MKVLIQEQEQTERLLGKKKKKMSSEYYFFACGLFWAGGQELGDKCGLRISEYLFSSMIINIIKIVK